MLGYADMIPSHWFEIVTWLGTSNQRALFHRLFIASVPASFPFALNGNLVKDVVLSELSSNICVPNGIGQPGMTTTTKKKICGVVENDVSISAILQIFLSIWIKLLELAIFVSFCRWIYHERKSVFIIKMGKHIASFWIYSFFSQCKDKYSTNLTINDGLLGIRTQGWEDRKRQMNLLSYL